MCRRMLCPPVQTLVDDWLPMYPPPGHANTCGSAKADRRLQSTDCCTKTVEQSGSR